MESNFLKNLKSAVDNGEFNSEAAKKIIEIDKLADTKNGSTKAIDSILENMPIKTVDEAKILETNVEYEKRMQDIKDTDIINNQIAILREIDDNIKFSIMDMYDFISSLENRFDKAKPSHFELFDEIERLKTIYNSIVDVKNI